MLLNFTCDMWQFRTQMPRRVEVEPLWAVWKGDFNFPCGMGDYYLLQKVL